MNYTLQDLCQNKPVPELRLVTEPGDFSQISIESASFQEVPPDDYIKKDELVLSTAAGCMENPALFTELIRIASQAQAAAIIYSIMDDDYTFPRDVVEYANEVGIPLFRLPWRYRLSDINSFVARQIQNQQTQGYRKLQSSLFNLFFESGTVSDAAQLIEGQFDVACAIVNQSGRRVGASRGMPADAAAEETVPIEICINNELYGYLILQKCERCDAMLADRELLERFIVSPVSLWFYRKNIEDMVVMKLKNDFVWDLVNRNYSSIDEMKKQGSKLNFDLERPYTCLVLRAEVRESGGLPGDYSNAAAKAANVVESIVLSIGKTLNVREMFAERSLQFILFVENRRPEPGGVLERYLELVDAQLEKLLPLYEFYWGLSEISLEPREFDKLYNSASLALQYCMHDKQGTHRFTYQNTREAQIISALSDHDDIHAQAEETLKPLFEYGASNRLDLMQTLAEFISCNYNTSLTARKLHIHRQTLLYRLEKIEALTNLSLSNHKDLFLLEVYSRIFSNY